MAKSSVTIIDDKNLRGVLASPKVLSKELLEDIIDLIEWSRPKAIKETEERVVEADRDNSWISWDEVKKSAKRAK